MLEALSFICRTVKQEVIDEFVIAAEITAYYYESFREKLELGKKVKHIEASMSKARSYSEWKQLAEHYDQLPQVQELLNTVYSPFYDYEYIEGLKNELRQARQNDKVSKLVAILRSHSSRNVGNITSELLYKQAYNSTKKSIEEFQEEIALCLRKIMESDLPNFKKLEFFGELRHAVGRSALLLSGGAILGMHHIGVVQALMEADCMPKIIAGSSAGSMIGALIATRRRQDFFDGNRINFQAFVKNREKTLWQEFKRVLKTGCAMDITVLKTFLRDNLGDITFQEAFDQFGYILNITVTGTSEHDEDRLLNYLTAPNVMIWSACAASCAIPFVFGPTDLFCKDINGQMKPYTLMNRKFLDGSIGQDLPMNKLSIFFNVNNFIVSQTNPWVIPFMDYTQQFNANSNVLASHMIAIIHRIKQFSVSEIKHRVGQLAFLFPTAITKFFNLATQSYVGNITIWPVPSLKNYLRILENPTDYAKILNFVEDGRFRTYPKICRIKNSLFYENQIAKCLKRVRQASFIMQERAEEEDMFKTNKDITQFEESHDLNEIKDSIRQMAEQYEISSPSVVNRFRNQSFMIPRENSF